MDRPVFSGELEMPRFIQEGYEYLGEDEQWAKKEFEEYYAKLYPEPDEDGVIIQY